jgi:hypothetical protein
MTKNGWALTTWYKIFGFAFDCSVFYRLLEFDNTADVPEVAVAVHSRRVS